MRIVKGARGDIIVVMIITTTFDGGDDTFAREINGIINTWAGCLATVDCKQCRSSDGEDDVGFNGEEIRREIG